MSKLRQVDALAFLGESGTTWVRSIDVTKVTYDRWQKEYDGLNSTNSSA